MPIPDSDWAALTPYGGKATTLVSAATLAPTTFLTVLTGNNIITTIAPPVPFAHMLAFQFAGTAGVTVGGNINGTKASVVGEIMLLVYNPATGKYVPVG